MGFCNPAKTAYELCVCRLEGDGDRTEIGGDTVQSDKF